MIKIAILPFWLWLTSIIPCQNCVQKEAPLRFSQSSNHNQKAIITLMKLFSQYPRVYVFILPYFTWTFHVSHLWGNKSLPDEDHHRKNCCHLSKTQSLDAGLTYSLVGVSNFAIWTISYSPGKISTASAKDQWPICYLFRHW